MKQKIQQEIIDKIQKLLDHHAGALKINSEQEAMTAMSMAKKLMEKHHLDMMMFYEQGCSESDITHKQIDKCSVYSIPIWLLNIINIVNNICNCSCILEKIPQPNGYIHTSVVFVSQKNEMDHVFEMYMFFKKTTYRLANKHIKNISGNYTNWRSFAEGFTSRLLERSRENVIVDNTEYETDIQNINDVFEEDDFVESNNDSDVETTELCVVEQQKKDLAKYLKDVRLKIDEYIRNNIDDVKQENIKSKSKVLLNSYNLGRKLAENQNMKFVDKSHQLTSN